MELSIKEFDPIKARFVKLVNEETFLKEASFAMQHIAKNPKLLKCDKNTIIQSVLNVAQTGLSLNPVAKLAYLVPRWMNGGLICCLDPSYQGLVKLITDTGSVTAIYAHLVHENDEFEQSLGTSVELMHKPKIGDRGEPIAVYAVAVLKSGIKQVELMEVAEINAIRDSSESYKAFKRGDVKSCVWEKFWSEMARKTVIKRITKYLPKTEQWDKVNEAIQLDNQDYGITGNQIESAKGLLKFATFSEEKKNYIEETLHLMTREEGSALISDLKDNQMNPLKSGQNYSQTDILENSPKK